MTVLPFDILVITDRVACERVGRTVAMAITQLLKSPLSHRVAVLVRDKSVSPDQVVQTIQTIQPLTQAVGAKLLVHTHVNLALAFGLEGVHVASSDNLAPIRAQLSPGMLLGASRHAQDALDETDIAPADYATLSPIYRPTSKPDDTREPLGLSGLATCLQRSVRPLVALGGIQPGRVTEVIALGAGAIAVSGALLQANDPARILQNLCFEVDQSRGG
jgi:thiamine-phosphate pyrophosphorylase